MVKTFKVTSHFPHNTGWVGWGLSAKGGMKGSDMVMGWVDNSGNNHFQDRHGTGNREPVNDKRQDYTLIEMSQDGGYTEFTFTRSIR